MGVDFRPGVSAVYLYPSCIALTCAVAIMTSLTADNQLRVFMLENQKRRSAGLDPILLLDTGESNSGDLDL